MFLRRFTAIAAASVIAATSLVACGSGSGSDEVIRIGTTDSSKKAWQVFEKKANENDIKLEIVNFGDYNTPNRALSEDQLDVNLFQHLLFLAEYNKGAGDNLTPIGSTEVVPLALFWKDHDSVDGIEGQSVSIPKDSSNQGRAINVLADAGLLTLKEKDLVTPTPADIDEAKSKVKVTPVDAAQTTTAYGEGTPAIINNSFLDRAGIDPNSSILADDPASATAEPFINVFVTKAEDKDDPKIKKLAELWHDQEVLDAVAEDSGGTSVPVKRSAEELQQILDRIEESLK
ncbi:methionine ABC transporter substrate-binding protein [Corynebacterium canis]|uniref:Methionine ABC transporter substrate-binding protein n=1 Tax=Corynebacterium canis TaxID=679663 RepID=A0A5C5UF62_9CORY|nr:MetQ/NlpA family ABC transporter substrate-binding protein [Corynebacterium canis]TWT24457.1 methionine ABC transporter substrate-binding protein [Corynebacterium canis]WJY74341.1 D-methionine-binding lipoprotein MetQ precursor [Corynebacterium canis]